MTTQPTMQRRHFEAIAKIIREFTRHPAQECRRAVGNEFADALMRTNPYFNRDRFLRACGVEG